MKSRRRASKHDPRLAALEAEAEALGAEVRYEDVRSTVRSSGGLCRVRGTWRIIVDRRLSPRERAGVLARELERLQGRLGRTAPDGTAGRPAT